MANWDERFLGLAQHVASWSKDPSTKVGAVITDGNRIISLGYNGFACGVHDEPSRLDDRDTKYRMVIHAEGNAILFAHRPLHGCTIYTWPFQPCSRCAALIIQAGIKRVVAPAMTEAIASRWQEDVAWATIQFNESGVELVIV